MRSLAVLALVAVAACSSAAPAAAPANQTPRRAPTGPAPGVAYSADGRFDTPGLPAIARGGEIVVVPSIDPDGGRGNPNLTLLVRDRSDKLVETIKVVDATEVEDATLIEPRIAAANGRLGELHAEHDLVPMVPIDVPERLQTAAATWPAPQGKRCAQCEPCENPGRVAAVYQAPNIDTLVVRITYSGTDTCWEPADQLHVVR